MIQSKELKEIRKQKKDAIKSGNFHLAAYLRLKEKRLMKKLGYAQVVKKSKKINGLLVAEYFGNMKEKYSADNFAKLESALRNEPPKGQLVTTESIINNKKRKMTAEQKQVQANLKAQKDAETERFKRNARETALSTAKFIRANDTYEKVLKDADKIFQWLIKPVK